MRFCQWIAIVLAIVVALELKPVVGVFVDKFIKPFIGRVIKVVKKLLRFAERHKFKTTVVCLSSVFGLAVAVFAFCETRTYLSQKTSAWLDINEVGKNENYPVDMVYLWCEDNPKRAQLREEWKEKMGLIKQRSSDDLIGKARYVSNDELKYSLRSVEKYAPWVNKIYIITDNQVPKWLNLKHPKIKIVDHKEIMPEDIRPVFSSVTIEYAIPNIPNLSEHFLLANDDTMFANPVKKEDFFKDGKPIYIFSDSLPKNQTRMWDSYLRTIDNAYNLVSNKYGKYNGIRRLPHHNIDPYVKSTMIEANKTFRKELYTTMRSRFRSDSDIQRVFYSYYAILKDKAYYKIQKPGYNIISYLTGKYQLVSDYFTINGIKYIKRKIKKIKMFCTNDTHRVSDQQRQVYGLYMDEIFPEKSQFEK